MSRILLKDIISLKNQKEVYLVQDDEDVFCTEKTYSKVNQSKRSIFKYEPSLRA